MKLILPLVGWQVRWVPTPCPWGARHACMQPCWEDATGKHKANQPTETFPVLAFIRWKEARNDKNALPSWRHTLLHIGQMEEEKRVRVTYIFVGWYQRRRSGALTSLQCNWSSTKGLRSERGHSSCTRLPPQIESSTVRKVVQQERKKTIWDGDEKPLMWLGIWQQTDGRKGCQLAKH